MVTHVLFKKTVLHMPRNRLLALIGALVIGLSAGLLLFLNEGGTVPNVPERIIEKVVVNSVDVLVAKSEIPPAGVIDTANLAWQQWPSDAARGLIIKAERPQAITEIGGALARMAIAAGEPVRPERVLDKSLRFMSTMLAPGKRAMAISLDQSGNMTAGGFVLPNDYVDVIRVEPGAQRNAASQTILRNIRVLAIGPNIGEKAGEKVVTGSTATLELDASQAEFLASALQGGTIVLALRNAAESGPRNTSDNATPIPARTIIRAGIASPL